MPIDFSDKKYQEKQVQNIRVKEVEQAAQKVAEDSALPYLNLTFKPIQQEALSIVSESEARTADLAVILIRGETATVAIRNPHNPYAKGVIDTLKARFARVILYVVSEFSLEKAWANYPKNMSKEKISGEVAISASVFEQFKKTIHAVKDVQVAILELSEQKNVSSVVELLLASSLALRVSDIHVEPGDKIIHLRLRIDGMMRDVTDLNDHVYRLLLSRIKLLSNLKLNIHNAAQDGRFSVVLENSQMQIRTSLLPGEYGENIVLRILNPESLLSIEQLGIRKDLYEIIDQQLKKPHGMILTTGPTGSGKTTTLYAFLKKLKTPQVKIITVEDPIEYHLEGISQTQVAPEKGYTFATGLRAILRQDPDVILVGEVRDLETADTALQAALTGHLVLSTLHANDSAGVVPRLIDIGTSPTTIGPALNMAIAQRLIRTACDQCKTFRKAGPEEIALLRHALANLPEAIKLPKALTEGLEIVQVNKCETCAETGYKGRIGIYEALVSGPEFEKFILTGPSITEIREFALQKGMTTLKQDGFLKVLEGLTTIEEVARITGE